MESTDQQIARMQCRIEILEVLLNARTTDLKNKETEIHDLNAIIQHARSLADNLLELWYSCKGALVKGNVGLELLEQTLERLADAW